ncbi:hypothetical protein EB001_15780 [bacterium]|nr:hypothetical protein [bacterium]
MPGSTTTPIFTSGTTFTISAWVKMGTAFESNAADFASFVYTAGNGEQGGIGFGSNGGTGAQIGWWEYNAPSGYFIRKWSTLLLRDPAAWYHCVWVYDSTNATAEDRVRIYVNGVRVTSWAINTNPSQNRTSYFVSNASGYYPIIGGQNRNGSVLAGYNFDGYMAEVYGIDGQALTSSSFGQFDSNNVWQPIKYTGTYGTNGFYLPFNDSTSTTTLGYDRQLNMTDSSKNNWTLNNFAVYSPANTATYLHDVYIDTPTPYNDSSTTYNRGNYPTLSSIYPSQGANQINGNLQTSASITGGNGVTMGLPTTGKWLFEALSLGHGASGIVGWFGVANYLGGNFSGLLSRVAVSASNGWYQNDVNIAAGYYGGDNIMYTMAIDMDSRILYMYWDGVLQSTQPTIDNSGVQLFMYYSGYTGCTGYVNFGQRPFRWPQTGYKALNSYNLANPSLPLV